MDRNERFKLFIQELMKAAPAATFEEARALLEMVLNDVEDEHSGGAFDPANWRQDGRLYPPQDDRELETEVPGVRIFKTVSHLVVFGENGAIRIEKFQSLPGDPDAIALDKPGRDGRCCPRIS